MKQNIALDPVDIGLLRADAEMFSASHIAYLIEQSGFVSRLRWR